MAFRIPAAFLHRAVRGLVGMVCLGSGLLLLARPCEASCGDYVLLRGQHLKTPAAHDPEHAVDGSGTVPFSQETPCNSPACRGEMPELPVPQTPPQGGSAEKPLALFAQSLHLEGGRPNCDWLTSSEHARPGFRTPLERPPSL